MFILLGDLTDSWVVTILTSRTIITLYLHYVYMFMYIWLPHLTTKSMGCLEG